MRKWEQPGTILTDDEVHWVEYNIREMLGPLFDGHIERLGLDVDTNIRLAALAERCIHERKKRGLSVREVAVALKVPQYRIRAIEGQGKGSIEAVAARKYLGLLGLGRWARRWQARSPGAAVRVFGVELPKIIGTKGRAAVIERQHRMKV